MAFKETIKKILNPKKLEDIDDTKTTDPYLRYLRRENRRIDEKYEKKELENKIRNEAKKSTRQNVYGLSEMPAQAQQIQRTKRVPAPNPYTRNRRYSTIFKKHEETPKNENSILNAKMVFGTELSPIKKLPQKQRNGFIERGGFI